MAYTTINKPSLHFNPVLYTGNGSSQSITGVGFQPDFSWLKQRNNAAAYTHQLYDIIRGVTIYLLTSSTAGEVTEAQGLTAFNADGFSIGSNVGINDNGINHVSWNWKANGAGVSNTQGSITSTVSANTTSGFSIVQGQMNASGSWTVGHGLGVTPSMIICRGQNVTSVWATYHKSLGAGNYLTLNTSDASTANTNVWNNTSPTSSVYSMNASFWSAGAGQNFIAYCFAEVKGFSKFGSYTGNGNADGPFVYTGFKPAFLIIKQTNTSGENWYMWDTKRDTFNVSQKRLFPNLGNSEETGTLLFDFLSNGFKIRSTYTGFNQSSGTFIYMALAENPFVSSTFVPTTAR